MSSARIKHLLWCEIWVSLDLLAITFGWAVSYGGIVGAELIAPASFVAFLFGLVGAAYVHELPRPGVADLVRLPLWILLGGCIGVKMSGPYSFLWPSASEVNSIAWAAIIAIILLIGWISLIVEPPVPEEEGCCSECGYDLEHARTPTCPECGHKNRTLPPTPPWGDRSYRPW